MRVFRPVFILLEMSGILLDMAETRRHFRIQYPSTERPILNLLGFQFEIIDLSESGVKFILVEDFDLNPTLLYEANVTFRNKSQQMIKGKFQRIGEGFAVLELIEGFTMPQAKVMEEHRLLIQKYGKEKE